MRIRSPSSSTTDSTAEDPMSSHYTEWRIFRYVNSWSTHLYTIILSFI
jgi:hypothetical protein